MRWPADGAGDYLNFLLTLSAANSRIWLGADAEARTMAKVTTRLVPFLIVCYFIAYLDRVNVGFAALTMNQDLGLSSSVLLLR